MKYRPMSVSPRVFAIILNWRKPDLTAECVESLLANGYEELSVVVVDNGSDDGSEEFLRSRFPNVTVLQTGANLGFSRGCNHGAKYALSRDADYVMLVNNDLQLAPGGVAGAVDVMQRTPSAGAVTGKIYTSVPGVIWQAGGHISRWRVSGVARGRLQKDVGQYEREELTGWASGAMSMFRAADFAKSGLLPEEYFFGQEEWDISSHLLRMGRTIVYSPDFVGYHRVGGSYDSSPSLNSYGGTRNRLLYAEKYLPPLGYWMWRTIFTAYAWSVMGVNLRRIHGDNVSMHVQGVRLACLRHRRGESVTLRELQNAGTRLGLRGGWES